MRARWRPSRRDPACWPLVVAGWDDGGHLQALQDIVKGEAFMGAGRWLEAAQSIKPDLPPGFRTIMTGETGFQSGGSNAQRAFHGRADGGDHARGGSRHSVGSRQVARYQRADIYTRRKRFSGFGRTTSGALSGSRPRMRG
jgi:hypothetical protein